MSKFPNLNEQMDLIKVGTEEIIPENELVKKIEKSLKNNKPLNIKLGCVEQEVKEKDLEAPAPIAKLNELNSSSANGGSINVY